MGFDWALRYAKHIGAIAEGEVAELQLAAWNALVEVGARQAQSVEGERPTRRFLTVMATLLAQGKAFLLQRHLTAEHSASANSFVGWQDEDFVYLLPEASYQALARFCRDVGEPFPVRIARLREDLNKEGISESSTGRNSATVIVGGQKRRVWKLKRQAIEALIGETLPGSKEIGTDGTAGTAPEY